MPIATTDCDKNVALFADKPAAIKRQPMQPKLRQWIWITLAVLALAEIGYLAMPPAVIKLLRC